MKHSLIIGGANGIGLSVALLMARNYKSVTIIDRIEPSIKLPANITGVF